MIEEDAVNKLVKWMHSEKIKKDYYSTLLRRYTYKDNKTTIEILDYEDGKISSMLCEYGDVNLWTARDAEKSLMLNRDVFNQCFPHYQWIMFNGIIYDTTTGAKVGGYSTLKEPIFIMADPHPTDVEMDYTRSLLVECMYGSNQLEKEMSFERALTILSSLSKGYKSGRPQLVIIGGVNNHIDCHMFNLLKHIYGITKCTGEDVRVEESRSRGDAFYFADYPCKSSKDDLAMWDLLMCGKSKSAPILYNCATSFWDSTPINKRPEHILYAHAVLYLLSDKSQWDIYNSEGAGSNKLVSFVRNIRLVPSPLFSDMVNAINDADTASSQVDVVLRYTMPTSSEQVRKCLKNNNRLSVISTDFPGEKVDVAIYGNLDKMAACFMMMLATHTSTEITKPGVISPNPGCSQIVPKWVNDPHALVYVKPGALTIPANCSYIR